MSKRKNRIINILSNISINIDVGDELDCLLKVAITLAILKEFLMGQ